ncbi:tyrosinase family oxidase copper chaperone [Streptomyces sp. NPDC091272]|uniref:tyrosinase family oxidase copper chaperone n=1 Tax=Streptomyces sp. NPDC091272 TaxID=3365981 RepID=UPI00380A1DBA
MNAYTRFRNRRRSGRIVPPGFPGRRAVLRALFGAGVVATTAGALAPILGKASAGPARRTPAAGPPATAALTGSTTAVRASPPPTTEHFTEMYRGRRIDCVLPNEAASRSGEGHGPFDARAAERCRPEVYIDGRPLHVMRSANGGYLSVVNHYESFPTLLAAARAAVDVLGFARLSETPTHTT